MAAFRKARPAPDLTTATAPLPVSDLGPEPGSDMGLVRVGGVRRPGASHRSGARAVRWGRSLRLGLTAALAVGMVGSVAMAAGVGVLPNPFDGDEPGRPTATVSPGESRDPMRASPSPDAGRGKGVPSRRPDSAAGGSFGRGTAGGGEPKGSPTGTGKGSRSDLGLPGDWRSGLALSCRDMRSGKKLEAERRRALERAAKGSRKVPQYCEDTLRDEPAVRSNTDTGTGTGAGGGHSGVEDGQNGAGDTGGKGDGVNGGNGDGGGSGHESGRGNGNGNGGGHRDRAVAKPTPTPTSFAALRADEPQNQPAPDPDPSYGVLPFPAAT